MITLSILKAIAPKTRDNILSSFVEPLNDVCVHYDISETNQRLACFLAQLSHESGGFSVTKENLNYKAERLMKVWPKRFPDLTTASKYAGRPELLANFVYANRMGNGPVSSGDGYKFCGRGLIQLTGKTNYAKFAEALNISVNECVAYMETPAGACSSAGWFWDNNQLNNYCDSGDFVGLTKRINGGINGLEDRLHHYEIALAALQA